MNQIFAPIGEIRVTSIVTIPWKTTGIVFGLATDGCLYRQVKKGWVPVSMKIVESPRQGDQTSDNDTTKELF